MYHCVHFCNHERGRDIPTAAHLRYVDIHSGKI